MAHTHELLPASGGGVCCVIAECGFELTADETASLISDLLEACEDGEDPDGIACNGPELLELAAEYLSGRGAWMGVVDALRAKAKAERAAIAKARGE